LELALPPCTLFGCRGSSAVTPENLNRCRQRLVKVARREGLVINAHWGEIRLGMHHLLKAALPILVGGSF